jgi:hypothetical protein
LEIDELLVLTMMLSDVAGTVHHPSFLRNQLPSLQTSTKYQRGLVVGFDRNAKECYNIG